MALRSLGIDIGTFSIKVAELQEKGNSYSLTNFFEIPLSVGNQKDRELEVLDALKSISSRYDLLAFRTVMAVHGQSISIRKKTFPFRERRKILKSLPFELEDEIPFESDQALFDAKIIRTAGKSAEVIAVASPRFTIQEALNIAEDGGFDTDVISADILALHNLFEDWAASPPEVTPADIAESGDVADFASSGGPAQIILEIGHSRTLLLVSQNGRLLTARTFLFGGQDIVEMLRKRYEVPVIEAQKILIEKGFVLTTREGASKDHVFFSGVIEEALKKLVQDLKLSVLEIQSELKVNIDRIGLLGGTSQLVNICPYLTSQIHLPVNILQHSLLEINDFENPDRIQRISGVAIGLAIEGLRKPKNPAINFRQNEFEKQSQSLQFFIEKWGPTIKWASALFVIFCVYSFMREDFALHLSNVSYDALTRQAKTPDIGIKSPTLPKVTSFIREKKKEIADRKALSQLINYNSALDVLNSLSQRAPNKKSIQLDLLKFSVREGTVSMEGFASSPQQVAMLKSSVIGISKDKNVRDITPSVVAPRGKTAFAMTFTVQRIQEGSRQ